MRARWSVDGMVELLVNEGVGQLLVDGDFGFEVGVDEEVGLGFDERLVAEEEGPVLFGDVIHAVGPVGVEGFLPSPDVDPVCVVGVVDAGEDELFFVITAKEVDVEVLALLDEEVDDFFGVRSPIDVVAHEDDVVLGLWGEGFPKGEEGLETAVDIADCKCSHSV